jgi:hypothetical protein
VILASIFIGPPGRGQDLTLPPLIEQNVASLRRHHPALEHKLFSGEDIVRFLGEWYPREVLEAYNALRPYAYKADLARYCILYELGGIYADISHFFAKPLPFDGQNPIVFRDLLHSAPWGTNNSVFAVPPRHKALDQAIKLVCANVARRYYGSTYLCPTGPALFGKAWATTCEAEELVAGDSMVLPRERLQQYLPGLALPQVTGLHALVLAGKIVAIKRKRRGTGGLGDLGIARSDDYVTRWESRGIYEGDGGQS